MAQKFSNFEIVEINSGSKSVLNKGDFSKKLFLPELSAAYCLSMIKNKVHRREIDPNRFLADEGLENSGMLIPYHLNKFLYLLDMSLSKTEFEKLWHRYLLI